MGAAGGGKRESDEMQDCGSEMHRARRKGQAGPPSGARDGGADRDEESEGKPAGDHDGDRGGHDVGARRGDPVEEVMAVSRESIRRRAGDRSLGAQGERQGDVERGARRRPHRGGAHEHRGRPVAFAGGRHLELHGAIVRERDCLDGVGRPGLRDRLPGGHDPAHQQHGGDGGKRRDTHQVQLLEFAHGDPP